MKIGPIEIKLSPREGARKSAPKRRALFILLALVIAGALGLSFLTANWPAFTQVASQPVCARICHFMQPEINSWKNSTHAQVSCYDCHIEDFYLGFSVKKLETGVSRVWLTAKDSYERPINADGDYSQSKIPTERCLKCHSVFSRNISPNSGLKITKETILKHLDAGLTCSTCHNRIAHRGAENHEPIKSWRKGFAYQDFMKMKEGCWRCHSDSRKYSDKATLSLVKNGTKASRACTTCHYDDFLATNTGRCGSGCHSREYLQKLTVTSDRTKAEH